MYDLCTRPVQPEPVVVPNKMESREDRKALERQQPELRSEERDYKQHGISEKTVTAKVTSTSFLGKGHHSLYANLNGVEVEGKQRVSVEQFLLVGAVTIFEAWRPVKSFKKIMQTWFNMG